MFMLFVTLGLQACSDNEDMEEEILPGVTYTFDLQEKIPIHVQQTIVTDDPEWPVEIWGISPSLIDNATFFSIDKMNPDLNEIRSVEILSLTYRFTDFNGHTDDVLCAGTLLLNGLQMDRLQDINIKKISENNSVYTVSLPSQINMGWIENNIKETHRVECKFKGGAFCFKNDMDFTVQIDMRVKIITEP